MQTFYMQPLGKKSKGKLYTKSLKTLQTTMPILVHRVIRPGPVPGPQTRINITNGPTDGVHCDILLGAYWLQPGGDWLDRNGVVNGPTPFLSQVVPAAGPVTFNITGIGGDIIVTGVQKSYSLPLIDGAVADAFQVNPGQNFSIPADGSSNNQFDNLMVRNPNLGSNLTIFLNSNQSCTFNIYRVAGTPIVDYPMVGPAATPTIMDLDVTSEAAVVAAGGQLQGGPGDGGWVYGPEYSTDPATGLHYLRCHNQLPTAPNGPGNWRLITVHFPFPARRSVYIRTVYYLEDDIQTGFNPAALGMKLSGTSVTNALNNGQAATMGHILQHSVQSLPNNPGIYGLRWYLYDATSPSADTVWPQNVFLKTNRHYCLETFTDIGTPTTPGRLTAWVNNNLIYDAPRQIEYANSANLYNQVEWQLYAGGAGPEMLPLGVMHYRISRVGASANKMGPPAELAPSTTYPTWRSSNLIKDTWGVVTTQVPGTAGISLEGMRDWSGFHAINGRLYLAAYGGHAPSGNPVNDVWVLDGNLPAPLWNQLDPGSPVAQYKIDYPYYNDAAGQPRGKPGTRHTYFTCQVLPGLAGSNPNCADGGAHDRIMLAGSGDYSPEHTDPDENAGLAFIDCFDIVTNQWDPKGTWASLSLGTGIANGSPTTMHPVTHDVYVVAGFGLHAYKWTRLSNTWSQLPDSGLATGTFQCSMIDGIRNLWLTSVITGPNAQAFMVTDLSSPSLTSTIQQVSGLPPTFALIANYGTWCHDTINDRYIVAHQWRDGVQSFARQSACFVDPHTLTSTGITELPGNNLEQISGSGSGGNAFLNRFAFQPSLKCMMWTPSPLDATYFLPLVNG